MTNISIKKTEDVVDVVENVETPENTDNQKHLKVGSYDVSIANEKVPLLGVAASAIILLVAVGVGQVGKKWYRSYGYALGSVALIIAVLGLLPKISDHFDKFSLYVNYFLFLWCFIGACIMTFGDGPFIATGERLP